MLLTGPVLSGVYKLTGVRFRIDLGYRCSACLLEVGATLRMSHIQHFRDVRLFVRGLCITTWLRAVDAAQHEQAELCTTTQMDCKI